MGIAKKSRRKIIVSDKSYPLKTEIPYIINKGSIFQNKKTKGAWNRYLLPFNIPQIITPKFVSDVILWATQSGKSKAIKWDGKDVPV